MLSLYTYQAMYHQYKVWRQPSKDWKSCETRVSRISTILNTNPSNYRRYSYCLTLNY